MLLSGLGPRDRCKMWRRLDVACLLLLILNILYILMEGLAHPNPALTPSPYRKCQTIRFQWDLGEVLRVGAEDKADWPDGIQRIPDPGGPDVGRVDSLVYEAQFDGDLVKVAGQPVQPVQESGPRLQVCPEFPANPRGELACLCNPVTPEVLLSLWPNLEPGGRLRPLTCRPRERLAIIIPFSNRLRHLHILMRNLLPILQAQNADSTFFIIEQLAPSMFNRATLHNIGFLEAHKVAQFDCYIFHDVDLVPLDDRILYRCADNPRHFPVSIQRYGDREAKKMYDDYFGGVVALTRDQYKDINGNSNLYFGWGGEDDDLLLRALTKGYKRVRENSHIYKYQMLRHERNDHNRGNIDRMLLLQTGVDRQDYEGLSTTTYTVKQIRHEQLYIWVSVSLNMTQLLLTAPDYSRNSIKSLLEISLTIM